MSRLRIEDDEDILQDLAYWTWEYGIKEALPILTQRLESLHISKVSARKAIESAIRLLSGDRTRDQRGFGAGQIKKQLALVVEPEYFAGFGVNESGDQA